MKPSVWSIGVGASLLLLAELVASAFVWHGQPTGTTWEPGFWHYELARLQFWLPLAIASLALTVLVAYAATRWATSGKAAAVSFYFLTSLAAEYLASVYYWHNLSWSEAALLGWSYRRGYIAEHLYSWLAVVSIFGASWFIFNRGIIRRLHLSDSVPNR